MNSSTLPIAILAVAVSAVPGSAQDAGALRAGAATTNITPWTGLSLAGHMTDRKIARVHDELHARCLVLDNGAAQLAFVLIDSCMVPRDVLDHAKQRVHEATGMPVEHMLMAATHTHTGACATPVFQSDEDPEYNAFLERRIADAVLLALDRLAPAKLGWGAGKVPDEVNNRRWHMKPGTVGENPFGKTDEKVKMNPPRASENLVEPAGPTDPEVCFLAVQHADGRPFALLANYSLHYVGGTNADEVSADYFAMFAERMQALLQTDEQEPPFVAMMSNGTSGDINNINFRVAGESQEPYEQMRHVANKVAEEVYRVYQGISYTSEVALDAMQEDLTLGVRKPTSHEVEEAKAIMAAAEGPEMKSLKEIYARETVLIDEYPDTVPVLVQALRVGDVGIAAIPCEVFVEIGLRIKEESPLKPSFTIELANGYNGYLPTADHHALGGYETWRARSSYLEVDAAQKIENTAIKLLKAVSEQK